MFQKRMGKLLLKGLVAIFSVGMNLCPGIASAAVNAQVTLDKSIVLPGKPGAGDVVTADPKENKVYLAQKGNNSLIVIDTTTNTVAASIYGVMVGNGVTYSPDYIFAASEQEGTVDVISKKNWMITNKIVTGGQAPDSINYIAKEGTVAVVNAKSKTMSFLSAQSPFQVLASLQLKTSNDKDSPDLGTYSADTDKIYQPMGNSLLVINPKTYVIEATWTYDYHLKGTFYDAVRNVLWIGTSGKSVLAVDADTGKLIAAVDASAGQDQLAGDRENRLLFAGESSIGATAVIDMDAMKPLPDLTIGKEGGAHTLDILPSGSALYVYEPNTNKVDVFQIKKSSKVVSGATSPVTGIPVLPIGVSSALLIGTGLLLLSSTQRKLHRQ